MEDRKNTALVIARSIADTDGISDRVVSDDYNDLLANLDETLHSARVDILRIYDSAGNVIASASDQRERGESHLDDTLLQTALREKKAVTGFGTKDHVLAPLITARAVYPLVDQNSVSGAIEVGYLFDSAFVDFSKTRTGLDVTIFTGDLRSATTIYKEDGVSRFVGTVETQPEIAEKVLTRGETIALEVERLGVGYYTAYVPLRDYEGDTIGMVSVGTPTFQLFEDSRQQLLTSFLILTFVSLLAAAIGYTTMRNFEKYSS
jgi:sensor histidine kinase regulating citrate/malate metabolism